MVVPLDTIKDKQLENQINYMSFGPSKLKGRNMIAKITQGYPCLTRLVDLCFSKFFN